MKENKFSPVRASVLAAMGLGFALASASSAAAVSWYSPITAFQDDDLDWFIDSDAIGTPGYGILSVGDRLVTVLEFEATQGVFAGQGPSTVLPGELTGVADITVTAKIATGAPGEFRFYFGPTAGGLVTGGSALGVSAVANIAGALAVVWYDSTADLDVINGNCGTFAQCIAAATDGTPNPYAAFGITANDPDSYWTALGSDQITAIAGEPASTKVAQINYGLEVLVNNTGETFGLQNCPLSAIVLGLCATGDGKVGLIGSGDILGGQGLANGAFARSDIDAQVARVPEPGSLALLGLGLAGLAASTRRRKARS